MATYKTPDVYVEEISTLSPSVVEVSTAIPAFIGYVENGSVILNQPVRITTFLEYQEAFGGPKTTAFKATINSDGSIDTEIPAGNELKYLMYYCLDLYFKNGGGPCYIVPVGIYDDDNSIVYEDFSSGLTALEKEDEPTIIVLPDAVNLAEDEYYALCNDVLAQCHKLGDRFGVFDILDTDTDGSAFRNSIRSEAEYLKYGAAYIPYLQTSLAQQYDEDEVQVQNFKARYVIYEEPSVKKIKVTYLGDVSSIIPKVSITVAPDGRSTTGKRKKKGSRAVTMGVEFTVADNILTIALPQGGSLATDVKDTWELWKLINDPCGFDLVEEEAGEMITTDVPETSLERYFIYETDPNGIKAQYLGTVTTNVPKLTIELGAVDTAGDIAFVTTLGTEKSAATLTIQLPTDGATPEEILANWSDDAGFTLEVLEGGEASVTTAITAVPMEVSSPTFTLSTIQQSYTAHYNNILTELDKQKVILPPSAAIAGAYVTTDRDRGVWKAPANVSIVSITGPMSDITSQEQENLNVDTTAGKSINAIRSFTGKGTLIWGARTLAGNDNEWRYVSVRRLFNTIEESCKESTAFAVFEPNDSNTWLKVKSMIDSYLYGLWQDGALSGSTPEEAYFINVGLGTTMTSQDILEGRMIVEVGIAAVRPAEFIILQFSHLLQES